MPTNQTADSVFDEDSPVYAVANHHEETNGHDTEEQKLLTIHQFIVAQQDDAHCRRLAKKADPQNSLFVYDKFDISSIRARLDGLIQTLIPASLRKAMLKLELYSTIFGHYGALHKYDTMRRSYYWPHIANYVYVYVQRCLSCQKYRQDPTHQRQLQPYLPATPLEFVAVDILGLLPKTKTSSGFIIVMTNRCSKLTRAIPTKKTTATDVAHILVEDWAVPYDVPIQLLTNNGPEFAGKFFSAVCARLGTKSMKTATFHPQTNGQTGRYNKTILSRLRHYINEN